MLASQVPKSAQETARQIRATPERRIDEVKDVSPFKKSVKRLDQWKHKTGTSAKSY